MKLIPLSQGQFTQVDEWNYDWLNQWKWFAIKSGNTYYAVRNERNEKGTRIWMHREIMNTLKGMEVDHINHNGLNNQEFNLRNCIHLQNNKNCAVRVGKKFKGITHETIIKKNGKIYKYISAQIRVNGIDKRLGYFKTEELAAHAYDEAARKYHGEFACLNFENPQK